MAGVEADEEINPGAMEVGKVEEEMDEELDTAQVMPFLESVEEAQDIYDEMKASEKHYQTGR